MNNTTKVVLIVVGVLIALCACCLVMGVVGLVIFNAQTNVSFEQPGEVFEFPNEATVEVIRPTRPPRATQAPGQSTPADPNATPDPAATPAPDDFDPGEPFSVSTETLLTLEEALVPANDLLELAERLKGVPDIAPTLPPPAAPLANGAQQTFWVMDTSTNTPFQVEATLQFVTEHTYFWVENGVDYRQRDLEQLGTTFENEIYPKNREFFGSEWTPGVDGDPHLYILYAESLGGSVAGYFSSGDQVPTEASEYSNAHEMFLLSAEHVALDEEFAYSVLAHEFQHMIHWYTDRNEETWMNEGFAELAAFLNGYDVGGTDRYYTFDPDMQLNDWPDVPDERTSHYGAAFMFLTYFLDRFGEDATKALVAAENNGMVSIDEVLNAQGATDPETGAPITAEDVFADWVLATYLNDEGVEDGRYVYKNYPNAPENSDTDQITTCPLDGETYSVSQFGVDYLRIDCAGDFTLRFEGSTQVGVLPTDAFSGDYAFWSNKGDESDMTLTRTFDFTNQSGPLTLTYQTWYDLETDYDYLYLLASTDGQTWQFLDTPSGTDEDPSGNSYGWGYNGQSGRGPEWIEEQVDLSQFAGQQVQIRFEYITDAAVNGEGFLMDDIAVPETGYFSDFESDEGGWEAVGFVRIQNVLPQTYKVSLISGGNETTVEKFTVSGDNTLEIPISLGGDVDEVVLVISGTTRFTRQDTGYRISIDPR